MLLRLYCLQLFIFVLKVTESGSLIPPQWLQILLTVLHLIFLIIGFFLLLRIVEPAKTVVITFLVLAAILGYQTVTEPFRARRTFLATNVMTTTESKSVDIHHDVNGDMWLRNANGNDAFILFPAEDPANARIVIRNANQDPSGIQLNLFHLPVRSGWRYSIRFRARADRPRSIVVAFAQRHAPWSNLGLFQTVNLTPRWEEFEQIFTCLVDDPDASVHFDVGGSDVSVELSSVRFSKLL